MSHYEENIKKLQEENGNLKDKLEILKTIYNNNNTNPINLENYAKQKIIEKKLKNFETNLQPKAGEYNYLYSTQGKKPIIEYKIHKTQKENNLNQITAEQTNLIDHLITQISQHPLCISPSLPKTLQPTKIVPNYIYNSLKIKSIKELNGNQGWPYTISINDSSIPQQVIGVIGDVNAGKTHIINYLFNLNLPETPTQSINIIRPSYSDSLLIIDTPGLNGKPFLSPEKRDEQKQIDFIIKSLTIHNSCILFYITNSFSLSTQKEIENIKSLFNKNQSNNIRDFFMLINNPFIKTEEQYNEFISNHIEPLKLRKIINIFVQPNSLNTSFSLLQSSVREKDQRTIIYGVFCPYLLSFDHSDEKNLKNKIQSFVRVGQKYTVNNITSELILKPLSIVGTAIFNLSEDNAQCVNNTIKLIQNKKEKQTADINKHSTETDEVKVSTEEEIEKENYWKYYKYEKPHYSYYVKNKELIIEIECPGVSDINIVYLGSKNNQHRFKFNSKEENITESWMLNNNKKFSNLTVNDYYLKFKIPSDSFDIMNNGMYTNMTYCTGVAKFTYSIAQK